MNNYNEFSTQIYCNPNNLETFMSQTYGAQINNRYIYVKQNMGENVSLPPSVHVNPRFQKNVFVNPKFQNFNNVHPPTPKIHINPNMKTINIPEHSKSKQIHVNPNVLQANQMSLKNSLKHDLSEQIDKKINSVNSTVYSSKPLNEESDKKQDDIKRTVFSSRTKLIRTPVKNKVISESKKIRRPSIRSKFKIIKACVLNKSQNESKKNKLPSYKYKLVRYKTGNVDKMKGRKENKFKIDNRMKENKMPMVRTKKIPFSYRNESSTKLSLIKIGDVLYRKSLNTLQKANSAKKSRSSILNKRISKSKYKIVRIANKTKSSYTRTSSYEQKVTKKLKLKATKNGKTVSPGKLRKCNIPCPYFKKFGRCKRYEIGKCFRKHDSDQIALCTKFLQGACVNDKCLLSHNVSAEKMPTCKFYLEGNCSKDHCTYLHVRISPKADICKDFLEGFCKKGAECDKRHQYLCPDFEKYGKCPKQRCPYPHGKMVRKYSVFDKNKFAKKCSETNSNTVPKLNINKPDKKTDVIKTEIIEVAVTKRYYTDKNNEEDFSKSQNLDHNFCEPAVSIGARPKLGKLPSFIAFEDS